MMYDGASNEAQFFEKYCGHSIPKRFISSSTEIFLHFETDMLNQHKHLWRWDSKGFEIEYSTSSKIYIFGSPVFWHPVIWHLTIWQYDIWHLTIWHPVIWHLTIWQYDIWHLTIWHPVIWHH